MTAAPVTIERDRQVRRVILIEGSANAGVLVLKLAAGVATGSAAILGDALHSLTDLANNALAWFVVRLSQQPPDREHPYGHRKFETLAVFALATLLAVLAFELALRAIQREDPVILHSDWALVVMLVVLGVNVVLASWQLFWARRLDSDILRADSRHTVSDVLTTLVVIGGWQAATRGHAWVDTAAALGVAATIAVLSFGLFRRSIPILVDQSALEPDVVEQTVLRVPGVVGVRSVRSRGYGAAAAVDVVASVAAELSTHDSHEIADAIENELRRCFPVEWVNVHVEPAEGRA
ncbi:MAG: cation diffusion facilitator family transporter [Myxococcota bacterium]|nr:cation diffusion facilitator family transporter [Myxococcota bacterium]